jgi:hypothetical protein
VYKQPTKPQPLHNNITVLSQKKIYLSPSNPTNIDFDELCTPQVTIHHHKADPVTKHTTGTKWQEYNFINQNVNTYLILQQARTRT